MEEWVGVFVFSEGEPKMQLLRRLNFSYVNVLLILTVGGFLSYFAYSLGSIPVPTLLQDNKFRELVFVFIITSLVTIYGLDLIFKKQRNRSVLETLRLLGFGYDIHAVFAEATNFLNNHNLINYDHIDPIFHNHYGTKRDDCNAKEARRRVQHGIKRHLSYFDSHQPDGCLLNAKAISLIEAQRISEIYKKYLHEINSKFSYSMKIQSAKLKNIYIVHEMLKNNIWTLSRYIDEPTSSAKRFRVFISTYRLIYALMPILREDHEIFYPSEINYEMEMTSKYYAKMKNIKYVTPSRQV